VIPCWAIFARPNKGSSFSPRGRRRPPLNGSVLSRWATSLFFAKVDRGDFFVFENPASPTLPSVFFPPSATFQGEAAWDPTARGELLFFSSLSTVMRGPALLGLSLDQSQRSGQAEREASPLPIEEQLPFRIYWAFFSTELTENLEIHSPLVKGITLEPHCFP